MRTNTVAAWSTAVNSHELGAPVCEEGGRTHKARESIGRLDLTLM